VPGQGFVRMRWGGSVPSLTIVFDEGTDTGPDFFGAAILDDIDVNGTLVGQGEDAGRDDGGDDD